MPLRDAGPAETACEACLARRWVSGTLLMGRRVQRPHRSRSPYRPPFTGGASGMATRMRTICAEQGSCVAMLRVAAALRHMHLVTYLPAAAKGRAAGPRVSRRVTPCAP
eukprot:6535368-Alexandrium_andersonii.AAC.1